MRCKDYEKFLRKEVIELTDSTKVNASSEEST